MERSLVLIKPDGVEKNLIGNIINIYEKSNLKVIKLSMRNISKSFAMNHYKEHKSKIFFEDLLTFITRGSLCAMVLEGHDAINKIREINGNTDPSLAREGSIRSLFGTDKTQNCVHASDSIESSKREIDLWFGDIE